MGFFGPAGMGGEMRRVSRRTSRRTARRLDRRNQNDTQTTKAADASGADPMEQIMQLNELKEAGAITQEEFDQKKAELLKQI